MALFSLVGQEIFAIERKNICYYRQVFMNDTRMLVTPAGFHTGYFSGGERLCAGKLISCGHRPQPPRGSGGMLPQGNFEILSPPRVI